MDDNLIIKSDVVIGFNDEFVEEVVIPEGITKIAGCAFKKCYGLKRIVFPSTLKSIGESAFEKCSSLETITLSKSIDFLGDGVFKECSGLRVADFSKSFIKQLPYECFAECKKLSKVLLPTTTVKVLNRCFTGCRNLTEIHLNEGLKVIEDSFYDCSSLKLLYIPSTLIHLEDISYRRNITTIQTTQEQFEKFKELLPARCELQKVSVVDGIVMDFSSCNDFEIEGTEIVDYIGNDESVTIPFGITQINLQAFYNKTIKTISFPSTLKKICSSAFEKCEELEVINLNEGLTTIEYEAFRDCKKLREISIPRTLSKLEECVFVGCKKVELVNCNGNLIYSFVDGCLVENGDTIIESFGHKIPENPEIRNIAEAAFSGYGYFHVTIPENIKNISSCAFSDCKGVESIRIKHDVCVESGAFKSDNLTQIELSSKCVNIDECAFVVPHNNMVNVYVDDVIIPEGFDYVVDFVRYNRFGGKFVDTRMKSGTHRLWSSNEWAESNGTIFPKVNIIHEGEYGDVYFVGYGFDIFDSSLSVAFYVNKDRLDWINKIASKIRLVSAEIDGVDYVAETYDVFGYLTRDISTYFHTTFNIDLDEFTDATKDAKEIHLEFDILDSVDNFLEGFGMSLLLR